MSKSTILLSAAAITLLAGPTAFAQPRGYLTNDQLAERLAQIANSEHAALSSIGASLEEQPLHMLTLSAVDDPDSRPALLITAGIDAQYPAGSEIAIRIAEQILTDHAQMLDEMTVYIVPRANPDGAAFNMQTLTMGYTGNARQIDQDRDRMINEDPPDDLNGDGYITMMRRLEPTLGDSPTHLADPDDPRLNIEPEKAQDQRAIFTLYPEGLDNDNDGMINEDGFAGVDLNQNFMHMWPEHAPLAGRYPLSEPEAYALARFVLDRDNIIAAVTIGKHDNLINQPDTKGKDITGRSPKGIDAQDADLYKQVGEWFKDATGWSSANKHEVEGSFHSWLYAHRGLPSFAIQPWSRPDVGNGQDKPTEEPVSDPGSAVPQLTPSPIGDISQETLDELAEAFTLMTGEPVDDSMLSQITPEMVEQFAAQAGIEVRRVIQTQAHSEADSAPEAGKKSHAKRSEDAKWLDYFEERGIDAFVDWEPFDHPTLGRVEIGGFKPGVKINPPADDLDELASMHTTFVIKLLGSKPEIETLGPEINDLGGGLYEVRIAFVNNGDLPTSTVFSRSARSVKPMVLRLSADVDKIVSGQRVDRVWGLDQAGGRSVHHWIFQSDDINTESLEIIDPRFGNRTIELNR